MRLIDADALIKQTTENRCVNCDRRKGMKNGKLTFVYDIGEVPCRACDVGDMIDTLDEAPTIGGWISVKDSLPEPDGDSSFSQMMLANLIYDGEGPCLINAMYDAVHGEWVHDMPVTGGKITHWMPCPKPPQEDEEDD